MKWLAMILVAACFSSMVYADDGLNQNLIVNGTFEQRAESKPDGFTLSGGVEYRYLGDAHRDSSSWGTALDSSKKAGEVSCVVRKIDAQAGHWFRMSFRGLPQANFAVTNDDLYMKVAFFGGKGTISYDNKIQKIYDQIAKARQDLTINGVRHQHGAEVWRTYQLDFCLPFPQVDELHLAVGFDHGRAAGKTDAAFFVDDISLVRIPDPPELSQPTTRPAAVVPAGKLLTMGGRWFYVAAEGETRPPSEFNSRNVDRLLYHDDIYSAPFQGNTTAWMRIGDLDLGGNEMKQDRFLADNVTIVFDKDVMQIHTHGVPNHPTGRFPEQGFGNPNHIQEQDSVYYIPLVPQENPRHVSMSNADSNGALHMGPIGIAVNGVVFFNPFDMGNQDATDLMDRCCGHPNQDGQYHYHKYPICVNTPWSDDGQAHSPLLGWAFDGYPVYGPYESKDAMAKDLKGKEALNAFNMHYDAARGWHYHVTPGKFPYLIGGFSGIEDPRNDQRPHGRGGPGDRRMDGSFPPPQGRGGRPPGNGPRPRPPGN